MCIDRCFWPIRERLLTHRCPKAETTWSPYLSAYRLFTVAYWLVDNWWLKGLPDVGGSQYGCCVMSSSLMACCKPNYKMVPHSQLPLMRTSLSYVHTSHSNTDRWIVLLHSEILLHAVCLSHIRYFMVLIWYSINHSVIAVYFRINSLKFQNVLIVINKPASLLRVRFFKRQLNCILHLLLYCKQLYSE